MKRMICLVCVCAFVLPMLGGLAAAETCDHSFVYADVYRTCWHTTATTHEKVHQRMQVCNKCAATVWFRMRSAVPETAHDFLVRSNWHNSDDTHRYTLRCSVCGYSRTETRSCDGTPCMNYMGVPIHVIVVDE